MSAARTEGRLPFPALDNEPAQNPIHTFALATSSKLEGIIAKFEDSTLASREYYNRLLTEGRLFIVDGPRILTLLQNLYKKTHLIPSSIALCSKNEWHQCDGVYLGTISGADLVDLYQAHGDALFFENIRDFLGTTSGRVVTTRSTVNEEIIKTIKTEPAKMLARNNGLTFRAAGVSIGRTVGPIYLWPRLSTDAKQRCVSYIVLRSRKSAWFRLRL